MNFKYIKSSSLALLSFVLLSFQQSFAADLVVIDNGPAGTYGSITAAITAAANGDRILVTNKPSGGYWIENLSINKSLTFVSATDNERFRLQGSVSILAANNREVTLIGLEAFGGTVSGANNTTSSRTVVNLLGCSFNFAGNAIDFDYPNYDLTVANCDLGTTGDVTFRYGKVLGNQLHKVLKRSSLISTNDLIQIIGNRCVGMELYTDNGFLQVKNNFVKGNSTSTNTTIFVDELKPGNHEISNNTIDLGGNRYGITLDQATPGATLLVFNNVILQSGSRSNDYGIYLFRNTGSSLITEYNYIRTLNLSAALSHTLSATDATGTTFNIDADGRNAAGSAAINGGNPSINYYDLDLTRGDAGAYGGSFTLDNYFPLTTGSSRVYHVILERGIFQGYNLDVKALGFDR
jgi:hypothetical protein